MELLLASKSPRRQQLLREMGLEYRLVDQDADESIPPDCGPWEAARSIAFAKAEAFPAKSLKDNLLLAADTIVVLGDKILGKPGTRAEAVKMLRKLSGRQHIVVTAMSFRTKAKTTTFCTSTDVYFAPLSREEISFYVDTFKPFDKAGAYGIQEWIGFNKVTRIEGSYTNVMGLPTERLYAHLSSDHPQVLSSSGRI